VCLYFRTNDLLDICGGLADDP